MNESPFSIAEHLPNPVFVFDDAGITLEWMNNAAEAWLRHPFKNATGSSLHQLPQGFGQIEDQLKIVAGDRTVLRGHDISFTVLGTVFTCSYRIFPLPSGVALQLDPRSAHMDRTIFGDRGQAVLRLGQMLAHEMKNPLAGIRGAAQLLADSAGSDDERELTILITNEVDRLKRLVERIESFDTNERPEFFEVNVHSVLRKAKLLFQNQVGTGVKITEAYDPSLPPVLGDADRLTQLVINLIANAVDAVNAVTKPGHIELITLFRSGVHKRLPDGRRIRLPVELRIVDNGPGIPDELRPRIFHPFVTSKTNGQGFGLALVSKIVDEHSGLLELSSRPGRTKFSLYLPVAE